MSDKEDYDLDALVAAANALSPELRAQFVELIPPELQVQVLRRLGELDPSMATQEELSGNKTQYLQPDLPPTIITEPGAEVQVDAAEPAGRPRSSGKKKKSRHVNLVKLHARGAVGEVFVAFDDKLIRELALKRVRNDLPNSELRFNRFIREAKITASLQHPGIVPIYDLQISGGDAHYTMPLVSGSTLAELIKQTHEELGESPTREQWLSKMRPLLNNFIAVCNAIDYAHSQKVLHRDIKPANIMIGTQGQTLVLDWGCAKDLNEADSPLEESNTGIENDELAKIYGIEANNQMTMMGSVIGTIAFMSPEQASGDSRNIGLSSDIFGLGATLFNLLTNEVAYDQSESSASVQQSIEDINQGQHRSVAEVDSRVPVPLAAVCMRSMAYDPDDRYPTAGDLGRDIDAFLAGDAVSAWREPLTWQAMRFVKRYRTAFATLAAVLLVGFMSLAYFAWSSNQQRVALSEKNEELAKAVEVQHRLTKAAKDREIESQQQLYETEMLLASEASSEPGGFGRMRQLVERWREGSTDVVPGWEWQHLNRLGNLEKWKVDVSATVRKVMFTREVPVARVFDSAQSLLFKVDVDNEKILERRQLPKDTTVVDFNRDQSLMAIGKQDGTVVVFSLTEKDADPVEFKELDTAVTDIRWNIGGDYIAACDTSGKIAVWQWYERALKHSDGGVVNQTGKQLLNWSYDGKQVCWTSEKEILALNMVDLKKETLARDSWILNPCWSHEGKLLAYIGPENTIVVIDLAAKQKARFSGHQLYIESLQWHPAQHYLLSSSADGSVRIWNADTQKEVRQLLGHDGHVFSAAWSPDGEKVVSGGVDNDRLRVWDASDLGNGFDRELQDHPAFDWHPDGMQVAVAEGTEIMVQDGGSAPKSLPSVDSEESEIFGIAYNPTGDQLACIARTGRIWTVDANSGDLLKVYDSGGKENCYPEITAKAIRWSPDGKYLAGVGGGGKVHVWDLATGESIGQEILSRILKPLVLSWSSQSQNGTSQLALAGVDDFVCIFDTKEQKIVKRILQYGRKTALAWSPDGKQIAMARRRGVGIWNLETGEKIGTCEGSSSMIRDVSWSSSQNRIAALAEDGLICLWNSESCAYCGRFSHHKRTPYAIRWSPDGKRLASTARYGRLVLQSTSDTKK